MQVWKQDSAGTHPLAYGGSSPGSPLLSDGTAVYTAGISERRGGVSKFSLEDLVGSTNNLADGAGAFTDGFWYDAFGIVLSRYGSTVTPFGYTGAASAQTDATSGLMLMGNRFYDAATGRFLSLDPARSGTNGYAYCSNNPVNQTDPLGLDPPKQGPPGSFTPSGAATAGCWAAAVVSGGSTRTTARPRSATCSTPPSGVGVTPRKPPAPS